MAYSYPIWNIVKSCIYKSDKSYGARDYNEVIVKVGTSATNSQFLVSHLTTRRIEGDYTAFRFAVDTGEGLEILKTMYMHTKTRKWYSHKPRDLNE